MKNKKPKKVICSWCNRPKAGVQTGICEHCGRFGKPIEDCERDIKSSESYKIHRDLMRNNGN